jgi:cytoskeletal protein CcmA (bactofilin family)
MIKKNSDGEGNSLMNTIIGKDTVITGTLEIKGALRVDGTVKGKIICSDCVTVGATGLVEADIESGTAVIAGRMLGNVHTTEKIELQAKCEMEGDIKAKSLVIEQGAIFCGACNMKDRQPDLGFLPPDEPEKKKEDKETVTNSGKPKKSFP